MVLNMNKIIKQQLERCQTAEIPPITDDIVEFVVPMGDKKLKLPHLQLQHYYIIELED